MVILLSILITAVAYLTVPVIFSVIGYKSNHQYSLSIIRKIVIINGACVWLIFQIIRINAGDTGTSSAVFLWSAVAYWIMKKILLKDRAKDEVPINPYVEGYEEVYEDDLVSLFQSAKKARKYKVAIVVMSFLLALSLGLNVYQVIVQSELVDEVEYQVSIQSELEYELEQSQEKLEQSQEKLKFFDEYVVFVEDDDTLFYHTYECERFKGEYFWAYNINLAIDNGYHPCPLCCRK